MIGAQATWLHAIFGVHREGIVVDSRPERGITGHDGTQVTWGPTGKTEWLIVWDEEASTPGEAETWVTMPNQFIHIEGTENERRCVT